MFLAADCRRPVQRRASQSSRLESSLGRLLWRRVDGFNECVGFFLVPPSVMPGTV